MPSQLVAALTAFSLAGAAPIQSAQLEPAPAGPVDANDPTAIFAALPEEVRAAVAKQDAREITRTARPHVERCTPGIAAPKPCLAMLGMLAMTLLAVKDEAAARIMAQRAMDIAVRAKDPVEIAGARWVLAKVDYGSGDWETAERGFRESLTAYAEIGPSTLPARFMIELERVQLLVTLQHFGEAETAAKAVIDAAGDPQLVFFRIMGKTQLALTWLGAQRYEETVIAYRELVGEIEAVAGPNDPVLIGTLNDLAAVYIILRRYPEASEALDRADALARAHFAPGNQIRQLVAINRGGLLARMGRCSEAEPLLRAARGQLLDSGNWLGALASHGLARCLKRRSGLEGEALAYADASIAFPLERLRRARGFTPQMAREFGNYSELFREKVSVVWAVAERAPSKIP